VKRMASAKRECKKWEKVAEDHYKIMRCLDTMTP
jgi:hypothetical protein